MAGPAGCTPGRPAGRRVPADRSAVTGPAGSSRLGSARIELFFFLVYTFQTLFIYICTKCNIIYTFI